MRILYLTNGFPFPLTSGYLRHYFLMKELSKRHSITLLSLVRGEFKQEYADALAEFTQQVIPFPVDGASGRKIFRDARLLAGTEPAVMKMRQTVEQLRREEDFDVAFFSGKQTLPVIATLGTMPGVCDICDAASVRVEGRLQHARLIEKPRLLLGRAFMRRVERRVISRADHMLFASGRDRDALLPNGAAHATVVPNGVDVEFWKRTTATRGPKAIVFTGAMHYRPNVDAAFYLINEILPGVRKSIPEAELFIVGRDPSQELIDAGKRDGVTVTGFVDDVRPYLERATVFAAPLRFGAGIQNKVLEAMAMELPVVASPVAADGLRTEQGDTPPIEIAESCQGFVDSIVEQLKQHDHDPAARQESRMYVGDHFVWRRSGELVEEVLARVVKRPAVANTPVATTH